VELLKLYISYNRQIFQVYVSRTFLF